MNNMTPDDRLATRTRDLFRQSCEEIAPRHLAQLAAARREALNPAPRRAPHLGLLAPAGAAAVAVLAVAVLWQQPESPTGAAESPQQLAAVPAPEPDDVAFFGDLAFYEWLATQPATAEAKP